MVAEFAFELKSAKKVAVPALIGLWGKSGSGKTYSALLLARGIAGPDGKIAVIDTENNRALFYAGVGGEWMHCNFEPPFSPERYIAAFQFCEKAGAKVIVVDSMSHVWEGIGGVLDKADEIGGYGLQKFKAPKIEHKKMLNYLLRAPVSVIFCIRAKDAIQQVGKGKDMEIKSLGWQPIAEKNFIFEMTVDLHMIKDGKYELSTSKTVPAALRDAIRTDGTVNEDMGRAIASWCGSGTPADPVLIALKRDGKDAALQGVAKYTAWLAGLPADQKEKIRAFHKEWSADAKARDSQSGDLVDRIAKAIADAADATDLEATWAVDYSDDLATLRQDKPNTYNILKEKYDDKLKGFDPS